MNKLIVGGIIMILGGLFSDKLNNSAKEKKEIVKEETEVIDIIEKDKIVPETEQKPLDDVEEIVVEKEL